MGKFLDKNGVTRLAARLLKATTIAQGTDIVEIDAPGWYNFTAGTYVSAYLGFPGSISTSSAATSFLMYVSPATLGGVRLRLLFQQNKLSASNIWYNMYSGSWYKLNMSGITSKDSATT